MKTKPVRIKTHNFSVEPDDEYMLRTYGCTKAEYKALRKTNAPMKQTTTDKKHKFELKPNGSVERVGPFGSYGPLIEAHTKTEATARFLQFAFRAAENTPKVKIRNGAYQLAYESLSYGVTVESGVEGRDMSLCFSGAADWSTVNDSLASFDYYASADYQQNMKA